MCVCVCVCLHRAPGGADEGDWRAAVIAHTSVCARVINFPHQSGCSDSLALVRMEGRGDAAWGPGGVLSCKRKPHPAVRAFGDVREQRDETDMKRVMEGR